MINLIKKTPAALMAYFTVDSWRRTKIEQDRAILNEERRLKIEELVKANNEKEDAASYLITKYEAISGRVNESENDIKKFESKFSSLSDRFNKPGLSSDEKAQLITDMKYNLDRKMEITNKITNEFNDISNNITKNDLFGFIDEFIDNYKEFLSNLNSEQLACLTNALTLFIIISSLNTIIIAYYGNLLINRFNLEVKYPKLANIIKIKSKMSDKFIKFNMLYIYAVCLTMLFVNLYMFQM